MKTTNNLLRTLAVGCGLIALGLTAGCLLPPPPLPPPPGVVAIGCVPDSYFWDGDEYVGWCGDAYYYWGPERRWITCDPVRVQRVNVYVFNHPNWRRQARSLVHAQATVQAAPQVQPRKPAENVLHTRAAHPEHPEHPAHGHGHDRDE